MTETSVLSSPTDRQCRWRKLATNHVPIVFVTGVDPVRTGLVASLNHPGGNLTGVTTLDVQLGPKLLEVLHQVMPNTARVAVLVNPTNPAGPIQATDLRSAASSLGLVLDILNAANEGEIDALFFKDSPNCRSTLC